MILLAAAMLGAPAHGAASAPDPAPTRKDAESVRDFDYLVRRPTTLRAKGKRTILAVAGATVALYGLRQAIRDEVLERQDPERTKIYNAARDVMGRGASAPAIALGLWGASLATRSPRERETAALLLEAEVGTAVVTALGSFVLAAERPRDGDDVDLFSTGGHGVSLDTGLAAALVPPLRHAYLRVRPEDGPGRRAWKRSLTGLLWTGVALTAYQRMDADAHWAPDVFLGAMTGNAVASTLCEARDSRRLARRYAWRVGPAAGGGVAIEARIALSP